MYENRNFSIGNKINISTKAYATLNNRFLDTIDSSKERYSFDKAKEEVRSGKRTRPVVIIGSNKYHDKVIAVAETTARTTYNLKYKFETSEGNFGNPEILILEKRRTKARHVFKKFSKEEINNFIKTCKKNQKNLMIFFKKDLINLNPKRNKK